MITGAAPLLWALRVVLSSAAVMILPGALAVLAWHPRRSFDLLEFAGLAFAVSFGIAQLLTIAALLVHWSPEVSLTLLGLFAAVAARRAAGRERTLKFDAAHVVILVGLLTVAVYLWAAGAPSESMEDRIHVAIIERLAHLEEPSMRNIYYSPGIVYTYPFPGTHYMMALAGHLGAIPSPFLYSKLRAIWGIAAPVLLYGCVLTLFGSARIAAAAAIAAIALVANGSFAAVPDMYWGQMAPYSHASDVAMGVLLPALLLLTFEALAAPERREYWFSVVAALAMALMLVIAHTREIVQFLVYLTAFCLALLLARGPSLLLRRAAMLLAATIAILVMYRVWNAWTVPIVGSLVAGYRQNLGEMFQHATWGELFGSPFPLLDHYMPAFQPLFYGWNPIVLLVSPAILFSARCAKLTWILAASIVCYALILRYPAFAIPYTYLTYFEILYTPVRNVIFFVHILMGVGLFVLASLLSRLRYVLLVPLAAAAGFFIVFAYRAIGAIATQHIDVLFVPMLIGYAILVMVLICKGCHETVNASPSEPSRRWAAAFGIILAIVVYASTTADSQVVTAHWVDRTPTPASMNASIQCGDTPGFCAPPDTLIRFAHERLPADAIVASDLQDPFQPALFMPQQMVIWTGGDAFASLLDAEHLFPQYVRHLKEARSKNREQPFFNALDTQAEREVFLRDVGATHVLLNFRLYGVMKPILSADKDLLVLRYDDGKWAVYEVNPARRAKDRAELITG